MRVYENKEELKTEINKTFEKYIAEFDNIPESLKDKRIDEVDRTPAENLAYQVGWTTLVLKWEEDERNGLQVKTPSDEFKWNQLGELYQWFTDTYAYLSLQELKFRLNENINSIYVMIFGINRIINYRPLEAIPKDSERSRYEAGNQLNGGIEVADLKGWFVNRYVFYDKKDSVVVEQKANFDIAKKAFGLLDSSTEFLTVDSGSLDIKLRTPRGDIYFEYLSAGYKTCIYLVLGILKEIEFRFKEPYIKASEFDGVIMIDEIDLHLHPTWQAQLIDTLKILFPAAQFIVTTHSPSILQTLNPEEIIPLGMDEEGNTYIKELNLGEYGLQGWTLEEILKDVMEMPSTNSKIFEEVKRKYDDAMDAVDIPKINENYDILQKMLHLDNPLRKLLEIQMIGLEEEE